MLQSICWGAYIAEHLHASAAGTRALCRAIVHLNFDRTRTRISSQTRLKSERGAASCSSTLRLSTRTLRLRAVRTNAAAKKVVLERSACTHEFRAARRGVLQLCLSQCAVKECEIRCTCRSLWQLQGLPAQADGSEPLRTSPP